MSDRNKTNYQIAKEEADRIDVRGYDMIYREITIEEITSVAYRRL